MEKYRENLLKSIGTKKPENKITRYDWFEFSKIHLLTEEFIREFQEQLFWNLISRYSVFSEDFIREFQDRVDWASVSLNQKLSSNFIREFKDRLYWKEISIAQELTNDTLIEFKDKIHWEIYFIRQEANFEIMKKFILKTDLQLFDDFKTEHLNDIQYKELKKIVSLKTVFENSRKE